jgi:hypothetical protein
MSFSCPEYLFYKDIGFQLFNTNIPVLCTFDLHNKYSPTNILVLCTFKFINNSVLLRNLVFPRFLLNFKAAELQNICRNAVHKQ